MFTSSLFSFVNTVALNFWSLPQYPEKLKMEEKTETSEEKAKAPIGRRSCDS